MSQEQFTRAVAEKFFLSQAESGRIIRFFLAKIKDELVNGRRVCFHGFGSFTKKGYPGKRVRHPKTGKIIWIPPKTVVDFNPSKLLLKTLRSH